MHLPLTLAAQLPGLLAADDSGGGGSIMSIGILLLIPVGMYFLLIRPQRRRAREQQALQKSIGVGDEVLTTSGMYGFVTAIESDSDVIWVEIDDDVQVRLTRGAISGKVNPRGGVDATVTDDSDGDAGGDGTTDTAGTPTPAAETTTTSQQAARNKAATNRPTLKGSKPAAPEAGTESPEPLDG